LATLIIVTIKVACRQYVLIVHVFHERTAE